ncbi:MAG: DUF1638 domain-containing protein, partial [Actinobacteria bacterium]|nr:DUF1638 domain-containing protein [Actinomycetota bacterium]
VERLPGAHCYEFFAGTNEFMSAHDEEPGTFYLTSTESSMPDAISTDRNSLTSAPQAIINGRESDDIAI